MKNIKKIILFVIVLCLCTFTFILHEFINKDTQSISVKDLLIDNQLILYNKKAEIYKIFSKPLNYQYEYIGTASPNYKRIHEKFSYKDLEIYFVSHELNSENGIVTSYEIITDKYPIGNIKVGDSLKSIVDKYPSLDINDFTMPSDDVSNILDLSEKYKINSAENYEYNKGGIIYVNYSQYDRIKYKEILPPSIVVILLFHNDVLEAINITCPSAE